MFFIIEPANRVQPEHILSFIVALFEVASRFVLLYHNLQNNIVKLTYKKFHYMLCSISFSLHIFFENINQSQKFISKILFLSLFNSVSRIR